MNTASVENFDFVASGTFESGRTKSMIGLINKNKQTITAAIGKGNTEERANIVHRLVLNLNKSKINSFTPELTTSLFSLSQNKDFRLILTKYLFRWLNYCDKKNLDHVLQSLQLDQYKNDQHEKDLYLTLLNYIIENDNMDEKEKAGYYQQYLNKLIELKILNNDEVASYSFLIPIIHNITKVQSSTYLTSLEQKNEICKRNEFKSLISLLSDAKAQKNENWFRNFINQQSLNDVEARTLLNYLIYNKIKFTYYDLFSLYDKLISNQPPIKEETAINAISNTLENLRTRSVMSKKALYIKEILNIGVLGIPTLLKMDITTVKTVYNNFIKQSISGKQIDIPKHNHFCLNMVCKIMDMLKNMMPDEYKQKIIKLQNFVEAMLYDIKTNESKTIDSILDRKDLDIDKYISEIESKKQKDGQAAIDNQNNDLSTETQTKSNETTSINEEQLGKENPHLNEIPQNENTTDISSETGNVETNDNSNQTNESEITDQIKNPGTEDTKSNKDTNDTFKQNDEENAERKTKDKAAADTQSNKTEIEEQADDNTENKGELTPELDEEIKEESIVPTDNQTDASLKEEKPDEENGQAPEKNLNQTTENDSITDTTLEQSGMNQKEVEEDGTVDKFEAESNENDGIPISTQKSIENPTNNPENELPSEEDETDNSESNINTVEKPVSQETSLELDNQTSTSSNDDPKTNLENSTKNRNKLDSKSEPQEPSSDKESIEKNTSDEIQSNTFSSNDNETPQSELNKSGSNPEPKNSNVKPQPIENETKQDKQKSEQISDDLNPLKTNSEGKNPDELDTKSNQQNDSKQTETSPEEKDQSITVLQTNTKSKVPWFRKFFTFGGIAGALIGGAGIVVATIFTAGIALIAGAAVLAAVSLASTIYNAVKWHREAQTQTINKSETKVATANVSETHETNFYTKEKDKLKSQQDKDTDLLSDRNKGTDLPSDKLEVTNSEMNKSNP